MGAAEGESQSPSTLASRYPSFLGIPVPRFSWLPDYLNGIVESVIYSLLRPNIAAYAAGDASNLDIQVGLVPWAVSPLPSTPPAAAMGLLDPSAGFGLPTGSPVPLETVPVACK